MQIFPLFIIYPCIQSLSYFRFYAINYSKLHCLALHSLINSTNVVIKLCQHFAIITHFYKINISDQFLANKSMYKSKPS